MTRMLILVLMLLAGPLAAQDTAPRPLANAMDAMRDGDWTMAAELAARDSPAAADLVEWHRLRAGRGTADEVLAFLDRNADWPGLPFLRRKSEGAFETATDAQVLAFFKDVRPQTAGGALRLAQAQMRAGETGAAQAGAVLAWRTLRMTEAEQAAYLAEYGTILSDHHTSRLDQALWRGWQADADRMLPLVPDGWRALARARLALRYDRPGVDVLIEAVPDALRSDPGLAFERFAWRARRGRSDDAIDVLLDRSTSVGALGRPDAWADRRRSLSRSVMRAGDPALAYRIASTHFLTEGSQFADLEWLSGFLALRKLDDPETALRHFDCFAGAVETPISLGRAGYWRGRAHEALGQTEAAQAAYAEGAEHQTSFYGLLAAERAGLASDPALAGDEAFSDWRNAPFRDRSVFQAAILALASGEFNLGERFLTHMVETLPRDQIGQVGAMLAEWDEAHIAVMVGKRAADRAITLPGPYYALHPLASQDLPVPPEWSLSIARRESEFDPRVVSGAGARGLMQVMPATARGVARRLEIGFDADALLNDPVYNARIGARYLAEMAARFDGNPVMIAAAYNAGPSRPERWMELFGDPRTGSVDMIDWIETIPFRETRNYVMRVTESLPVYRARLGQDPHPVPFSEELTGDSLRAFAVGAD